jgi:hypothetical protein
MKWPPVPGAISRRLTLWGFARADDPLDQAADESALRHPGQSGGGDFWRERVLRALVGLGPQSSIWRSVDADPSRRPTCAVICKLAREFVPPKKQNRGEHFRSHGTFCGKRAGSHGAVPEAITSVFPQTIVQTAPCT